MNIKNNLDMEGFPISYAHEVLIFAGNRRKILPMLPELWYDEWLDERTLMVLAEVHCPRFNLA
jgi:hypothetical protein